MFKKILAKKLNQKQRWCGGKYPVGTAFLLNEGLALESSSTEREMAEALKLPMVFLGVGGISLCR